jgi:hypothetical protein
MGPYRSTQFRFEQPRTHLWPQVPQFDESLTRFLQLPVQQPKLGAQTVPHAPQFSVLV